MRTKLYILILILCSSAMVFSRSITLNSQNGGWIYRGDQRTIHWHAEGTENGFKITLWKNNALVGVIAPNVPAGNGNREFSWKAGAYDGGMADFGFGYKIKVKEKQVDVSDESDHFFTLKPKLIKADKPKVFKKRVIKHQDQTLQLKPDLSIKMDPRLKYWMNESKFNVEVKNNGTADFPSHTSVVLHIYRKKDGNNISTLIKRIVQQVPPLTKGQTYTHQFIHRFTKLGGLYSVIADVNIGLYKTAEEISFKNNSSQNVEFKNKFPK